MKTKVIFDLPGETSEIRRIYKSMMNEAIELYIVSAYLTDWSEATQLSNKCTRFRFVVGKDFGITRKEACRNVLQWLPKNHISDFLVADHISGFHPKAAIWRDITGKCQILIGSSNLTKAAEQDNVEANILTEIPEEDFARARKWVHWICERSVPVSDDWLSKYVEASSAKYGSGKNSSAKNTSVPVASLSLPLPQNYIESLRSRRKQLRKHLKQKDELHKLFQSRAEGSIDNATFYDKLQTYWSWDTGNRMQGKGWEIKGKKADFGQISRAFMKIVKSNDEHRDDIVRMELDDLAKTSNPNPARKAFFTEILCLTFPDKYPIDNDPVHRFLSDIKFRAQKNATEGARYIDLARKLRASLRENPKYPAANLAELDSLIWQQYAD